MKNCGFGFQIKEFKESVRRQARACQDTVLYMRQKSVRYVVHITRNKIKSAAMPHFCNHEYIPTHLTAIYSIEYTS